MTIAEELRAPAERVPAGGPPAVTLARQRAGGAEARGKGKAMSTMNSGANDGRFPDCADVMVRYPAPGMTPSTRREDWPWMPGVIEGQGGPD